MQKTLQVSDEERRSWIPDVPKGVTNFGNDHVSYLAKREGDEDIDTPSAVCYARLRPQYNRYDILCRPKNEKGVISLEDAVIFFQILKEIDCIPQEVEIFEKEGGIYCHIPAGLPDNKRIYAALTAYRWIDSHPPLVWQFLRIYAMEPRRHPFQILPYLISRYVSNCNHSFISTSQYEGCIGQAKNPLLGVGALIYFDRSDPRGEKSWKNDSSHVNAEVARLTNALTHSETRKTRNEWGSNTIQTPIYQLGCEGDILHPAFAPLFTTPHITKEQASEILEGLFTKETT